MAHDDHAEIAKDFDQAVNMTPAELERWLKTDDSKSVGWAGGENKTEPGGQESVGHKFGAHIVAIKHKKKADLTDDNAEDEQQAEVKNWKQTKEESKGPELFRTLKREEDES